MSPEFAEFAWQWGGRSSSPSDRLLPVVMDQLCLSAAVMLEMLHLFLAFLLPQAMPTSKCSRGRHKELLITEVLPWRCLFLASSSL